MITTSSSPIFLFYLVNELGESYYVDNNNNVLKTARPTPIQYSPDGWEALSIGWERNLQKFGLVRNFSISLGFLGDGALILEYIFYRKRIDEKISLLVQKREVETTPTDYAITYRFHYKGEIDLSTFNGTRRRVQVNLMEGGRAQELKAFETTVFDIPVTADPEAIRVKMDGIRLRNEVKFLVTDGTDPGSIPFYNYKNHLVDLPIVSSEVSIVGGAKKVSRIQVGNHNRDIRATEGWFFKSTVDGDVTIAYKFTVQLQYNPSSPAINPAAYYKIVVRRIDETNISDLQTELLDRPAGGVIPGTYHLEGSFTFPVRKNDELYLFAFCNVEGATGDAQIEAIYSGDDNLFSITFDYRYPTTYIKAFKPFDLYKRLGEKVTGSRDNVQSSLLEGSSLCITGGDAIRSIANAFIKTSIQSFNNTFTVLKCAGIGIEGGKIVLESRSHFLNDDIVIDLGEVKDVSTSPALEVMFNTIKAGYPDQKYDDVNGRYETNSLTEWQTIIKRIQKVLDLTSIYRADPFGIEFTRQNLSEKKTTDNSSDNDVFILNVDLANPQTDADGTYYNLKRSAYTSVTGVPDPGSMFNIEELTPKRILKAWDVWLRSCLWKYEGTDITETNAYKNKDLVTIGGPGGDYTESAPISVSALGPLLFKPVKLTVKASAPSSTIKVLQDTPRAVFRWTYQGSTYKGYLIKGAVRSKTNQEQEFIFLSHPDNDLTTLENG